MGLALVSISIPPPMRHGPHNGLPARVDRHMLHSDLLLPARAVAFQGFHLRGVGSGQLVQCPLSGVLLRNGLHMIEPPRHHHCRLVDCAHLHRQHGLQFIAGLAFLREVKLFGPEDALFPKARMGVVEGQGFANMGLAREGFTNASKLNTIIRGAFAAVQVPQKPHAFRKTLTHFGNEVCKNPEAFKAWSMNLGHENVATTINSYLPVTTERQMELIREMGPQSPERKGQQK